MQDRPDKEQLLDAVAEFLFTHVRPQIADDALRFRVLIAAHLCSVVALEIRSEDAHDLAELEGLHAILQGTRADLPAASLDRRALFSELNAALAQFIRTRSTLGSNDEAFAHVQTTLAQKLSVSNPRFDLTKHIEGEP